MMCPVSYEMVIHCIDILPAFETKEKKTVNNPIEAHIVAEVRIRVILGYTLLKYRIC